MSYIGNSPALKYTTFAVQHFTTSATTGYTLDTAVTNENDIRLVINNVVQQPGSSYAYTASGTTLTLSAATTSSDTMYCVFLGKAVQTVNPGAGSVGLSQLSATGTASSSTFLRGDNSWTDPGGVSLATSTNNQIVTVTGADAITGETNLSYDGTGVCLGSTTFSGAKINLYTGASAPANGAKDGSSIWFQNNTSSSAKMQMTFSGTSGSTYGPGFIGFNNESFTGSGKGYLTFGTRVDETDAAPTERLRIHSNGVASFNDGVALGVGTANTASNVLDDYEEGTWTPTDGTGSISFSTNVARYTKIGNIVMCTAYMVLSSAGSGGSNQIFGGLPFTSQNTTGLYTTFPQFWYNNPASIALNGVQINPNSTTIRLIKKASDTTQTWADVVQSDMVNGGEVNMTFWYIT